MADKGDALAIQRPSRRAVAVNRGSEVFDRPLFKIVDADEAMRGARAVEGQLLSVGRPPRREIRPARGEELMRLRTFGDFDDVNLVLLAEDDAIVGGRNHGRIAFGQLNDAPLV